MKVSWYIIHFYMRVTVQCCFYSMKIMRDNF